MMTQPKHPRALAVFFSTEMWERYGFYVVQSLLALYLSKFYQLKDFEVFTLVGSFTALTYIFPIIGGFIADKLLGQKITVLLGIAVLMASYLLLALNLSFYMMTFALAGIAVGTGLLKPNISSLLGNLYSKHSALRERGFIIFYMGITVGIILGTLLPHRIQAAYGWQLCFGSAAFGLLIAVVTFYIGIRWLEIEDCAKPKGVALLNRIKAMLLLVVLFDLAFVILSRPKLAGIFFVLVACVTMVYVFLVVLGETKQQRAKTISLLVLCFISAIFWAFYFQMFLSLTLFISRLVQPQVMGIQFPPPYYIAVESASMLFFGLFLGRVLGLLRSEHIAVAAAKKFTLGMLFICLAYGFISLSIYFSPGTQPVSPWFVLMAYVVIAVAELLISPVGLAVVTQLAEPKRVSTMMGVFFISLGIGGFLSGKLAQYASIQEGITDTLLVKADYRQAFLHLNVWLLLAVVVSYLGYLLIKRVARVAPNADSDTAACQPVINAVSQTKVHKNN